MTALSELELTAHHEAGHAVATVLRRGKITSININLDRTRGEHGETWTSAMQHDQSFITYAGPWAEARSQWTGANLDDVDDGGCTFSDRLATCFELNQYDLALYNLCVEKYDRGWNPLLSQHDLAERAADWSRQFETLWPIMCQVAQLLLAEESVTTDIIAALIGDTDQYLF